jgi:hypothetical protein
MIAASDEIGMSKRWCSPTPTGLVGELCGGENLGVTLSNADRAAGVWIGGNVAEGVDA